MNSGQIAHGYRTPHKISTAERAGKAGHRAGVVWLTGLPGAGKSTLAMETERLLFDSGWNVFVLDGDNIRRGLNIDLGFTAADRTENIRRIGEVAALFRDAGVLCIAAFISPYAADRDQAKLAVGPQDFCEVFVKADVVTCESRDPKGLYAKARRGEIKDFTGISAPYEEPVAPDLIVDTRKLSVEEAVAALSTFVRHHFKNENNSAR